MVMVCTIATVFVAPHPIPQDQNYHHFADTRPFLGIHNFANVASNAVSLLAGLAGLAALPRMRKGMTAGEPFGPVVMLCVGAILTAAGSAVYHWNPSDRSLVFDRLAMVIVFAAFLALLMAHFDISGFRFAFPILLIAGFSSIFCWVYLGDLRPYGIFQGFPIILFVLGSFLFPRTHTRHAMIWLVTIGYLLAKVCEVLDQKIYAIGGIVSGHTLKHLLSGMALWITVEWLKRRSTSSR
jgi:hypothetical protein